MKKYESIRAEISRTWKKLDAVKTAEKQTDNEWRNIPDAVERKDVFDEFCKTLKDLQEQRNDLQLRLAYLKNNARAALAADHLADVLTIWNSYAGKPYGEKTREKIQNEIKTRCGVWFYITSGYSSQGITLAPVGDCTGYSRVQLYTHYHADAPVQFLKDNKIQAVPLEEMDTDRLFSHYVENIPAQIRKAKKLYAAARAAQIQLEKACSAYREIAVDGMPEATPRGTIYDSLRM